jgi:hypothetical protein
MRRCCDLPAGPCRGWCLPSRPGARRVPPPVGRVSIAGIHRTSPHNGCGGKPDTGSWFVAFPLTAMWEQTRPKRGINTALDLAKSSHTAGTTARILATPHRSRQPIRRRHRALLATDERRFGESSHHEPRSSILPTPRAIRGMSARLIKQSRFCGAALGLTRMGERVAGRVAASPATPTAACPNGG